MSDIMVSIKNQKAVPGSTASFLTIGEPNEVAVAVVNKGTQPITMTGATSLMIDFTAVQVAVDAIGLADASLAAWKISPYEGALYLTPLGDQPIPPQDHVTIQLRNVTAVTSKSGAYTLTAQQAGIENVSDDSIPITINLQHKALSGDQPLDLLATWQDGGGKEITVPIGTRVVQLFTLDTQGIELPSTLHQTALFIYFDEGTGPGQMPSENLELRVSHGYGLDWQCLKQGKPHVGWKLWVEKPKRGHHDEVPCSPIDPTANSDLPPEVIQLKLGQLPKSILTVINGAQVTVTPSEENEHCWFVTEPDALYELEYQAASQKIVVWTDKHLLFQQAPNDKLDLELMLNLPLNIEPHVADMKIAWSNIPKILSDYTVLLVNKHPSYITGVDFLQADGEASDPRIIPQPHDPFKYVVDLTDGPVEVKFAVSASADALRSINGISIGDGSNLTLAGRPTAMAYTINKDGIWTSDGSKVHNLRDGADEVSEEGWLQLEIQAIEGSAPLETRTVRFQCVRFQPPFGQGDDHKNNLTELHLAGYDFTKTAADGSMLYSLQGADLTRANLTGANLRGVDMSETTLSQADLTGAILEGSSLRLASLHQARNFDQAVGITDRDKIVWQLVTFGYKQAGLHVFDANNRPDGSPTDFSQVNLCGADLSYRYFRHIDLRGSDLSEVDLRFAGMEGATLDDTTKIDAKWFLAWQIQNKAFDRNALAGKDLSDLQLASVDFSEADLRGVDLRRSCLAGTNFNHTLLDGADLRYADLGYSKLEWADFRGAILGWNDWGHANIHDSTILDEKWKMVRRLATEGMYFTNESGKLAPNMIDLAKQDFSSCYLQQIDLRDFDLHGTNWSDSSLINFDLRKAQLSAANLQNVDLSASDLREASLAGADLRGANLSHVDFRGTRLVGGDEYAYEYEEAQLDPKWQLVWEIVNGQADKSALKNADLSNADLRHADLSNADLRGANLSGTYLGEADLHGAQMDDTTIIDAKWRLIWAVINRQVKGDMLRGQDLRYVSFNDVDLSGLDLGGIKLDQAKFAGLKANKTNFENAILDGAEFREAIMQDATFKGANMNHVDLNGADLTRADFTGATLLGHADLRSTLTDAILTGVDLKSVGLAGADLTGADLRGATLPYYTSGITLKNNKYDEHTMWPADYDPQAHGGILVKPEANPSLAVRPAQPTNRRQMIPKTRSDST